MSAELTAITVGRRRADGSCGIGFDAKRVLAQRQEVDR